MPVSCSDEVPAWDLVFSCGWFERAENWIFGTEHAASQTAVPKLTLSHLLRYTTPVFTARRYAKRGICRRHVSVCLSVSLSVCVCACVCHTPVLYQNG